MLTRTLSAEAIKYHRTPTLLLAIGAPVAIVALVFLGMTLGSQHLAPSVKLKTFVQYLSNFWTIMTLPLGTAIVGTLAVGLEHGDNHFKQILVLPPSRRVVYFAKLIAVAILMLLSSLVFSLSTGLSAWILCGFGVAIPWQMLLRVALMAWLAIIPVLALHVFLATRWRNFAVSMGVGMVGTIAAMLATNSEKYWKFMPWTYPGSILIPSRQLETIILCVVLSLIVAVWGCWDFCKRDMI